MNFQDEYIQSYDLIILKHATVEQHVPEVTSLPVNRLREAAFLYYGSAGFYVGEREVVDKVDMDCQKRILHPFSFFVWLLGFSRYMYR